VPLSPTPRIGITIAIAGIAFAILATVPLSAWLAPMLPAPARA